MIKVVEYGIQESNPVFRTYQYETMEQAKQHIDIRYKEFKDEFEDYWEDDYHLGRCENRMWETDFINDCNLMIEIVDKIEISELKGVENA